MKASLFNLLIALFLLPIGLKAQDQNQDQGRNQRQERKEEIKNYKIAYITEKIGLTGEEAQNFWPIYNQQQAELQTIRKERKQKIKAFRETAETASDSEIEAMIRYNMETKRKELALEERYFQKYKTVLPVKKIAKLYEAERTFKKELLKRIKQSQNNPERRGPNN